MREVKEGEREEKQEMGLGVLELVQFINHLPYKC